MKSMLRVTDVAAITSLSISYLNKLRLTGLGPPYYKVGRAVLYDPDEVMTWLSRAKRSSTSERRDASINSRAH